MLKHLYITNYALIRSIEIEFNEGLTVLTGDSGAGKSILLEALGLLLGGRANFSAIRRGEEKCSIEAVMTSPSSEVLEFLKENGLDALSELILRRELTAAGRSRSFVNDTPVNLNVLKEIGRLTVDLHGQQENLALQTSNFQCAQLDDYVGNGQLLSTYQRVYHDYKQAEKKLQELREAAAQVRKDQDYFQFQFDELKAVNFDSENLSLLEGELAELENAEDIIRTLNAVSASLSDDERGAVSALRWAVNEIKGIAALSPNLSQIASRLKSVQIELDDLCAEVEQSSAAVEVNPQRLESVREKVDEFNRLLHKHSVTTFDELKTVKDEYELKLKGIESFDEELSRIEQERERLLKEARELASALSNKREASLQSFSKAVEQRVRELGMPKAQFNVEMKSTDELYALGKDKVQMLFNANGGELQPMDQVASGGEMARLMLALKSVQSETNDNVCLIFDEIDTGVSGEVAKRIGSLMKELGTKNQILAVTHLPGVAAKGQHHLKVEKKESELGVITELHYLSQQQRVEELASMFSGETLTEASLESARSLLSHDS